MHRLRLALLAALVVLPACHATLSPLTGVAAQSAAAAAPALDLRLPMKDGSTRFAVIGDSGTGGREQYEVAQLMKNYHDRVKFDFAIMLGDNIYGSNKPDDFARKFELPYKPLLDGGVKFYASLGNHDDPEVERNYKPFNMGGQRYYKFNKGPIDFFVLDSNYMDPAQLSWLEKALQDSTSKWKIAYFHHPLYNDGKSHGPDLDLRARLTPLFLRYGVNAVFSGHEHIYERLKPIDGIYYFVSGNSGKLMKNDVRPSEQTVKFDDKAQGFMLIEIDGDTMYFQVLSRSGETIDSGAFPLQPKKQ